MPTAEQDAREARKKRTIVLLTGGAVSLLLPLLGVVYLRMNEAKTSRAPSSTAMFERREKGETKVNVTQTVTIINPTAKSASAGASSIDFVKGGANAVYFHDKPSAAPAASTPPVEDEDLEDIPPPASAPKTLAKKTFNRPKLKSISSFNSFKGAPPQGTGGQNTEDMLRNIPGASNNPEVQKYLKSRGQ